MRLKIINVVWIFNFPINNVVVLDNTLDNRKSCINTKIIKFMKTLAWGLGRFKTLDFFNENSIKYYGKS